MPDWNEDMAHNRNTDPPITVSRVVPSWGIVTIVGAIAIQAGVVLSGLSALTEEVKALRSASQAGAVKVAEHEIRLADHERRMQALEQQRSK